ncbi:MAG: 23S rRNA (adenine(2503)-C(2))-methyltransferase RlmN [Clostridia bacterium]|nr:23S rRNA (adenine(2503)-C(2))-methyltransferase RlmN [Clostridia bacterium]MBR2413645.1 23S rRNA (adenine(2503)-C(2))-methyltransferase RlmN [Clostridia bacterium]MBR3955176.1 23S rRNA (adenine(2503)-C(2))-methyltransferase RlmN [Clostridia bacterium]
MLTDIRSLLPEELTAVCKEMGLPAFRAKQIFRWLHVDCVDSFDEMTNLSLKLREELQARFEIFNCTIENKQVSVYDSTVKYLFRLHDGEFVESVLMKYKYGYSLCVSSQVGCRMGCTFCASTLGGVVRSLTASEILAQIIAAQKDALVRVSHVVMMGMGEPLDNYDNTLRFLQLASHADGLNLSMRNISLSTCGIVPNIYRLAEEKLQLTLSVSLHAPNDALRSSMMPVNKKWNVDTLLASCREYIEKTSRRISFEYSMVRGVNDSDDCARELAKKLKGMLCHINLIPVNAVDETGCVGSTPQRVQQFAAILESCGLTVTVRRTLGADIDAACGQLRKKKMKGE